MPSARCVVYLLVFNNPAILDHEKESDCQSRQGKREEQKRKGKNSGMTSV